MDRIKNAIINGKTALGIELGSTRIKGTLIDLETCAPIASGGHSWENRFEDGIWTYHMEDVWEGIPACYAALAKNVAELYGVELTTIGAIGISAMMHGYLVFDENDRQLAPFRTWRNTITEKSSAELTALFNHNIPQRWAISHLYHSILNKEEHVKEITFMTTLAGYVHWKLTGEKVLGMNDASGMFPIDDKTMNYDTARAALFDQKLSDAGLPFNLLSVLPKAIIAGNEAGRLTKEGALLLDPTGKLQPGIPFCPPEGDGGTGMVATNSTKPNTGNVSAGTSVFLQAVLEKNLSKVYPEIDMITTPDGKPVAMVHCTNCTCELDAWVKLVKEALAEFGVTPDTNSVYVTLYNKALSGDKDCGGILAYNYLSGEHITEIMEGRPLLVRTPESRFNLANFMRAQLYASIATLNIGMNILFEQENLHLSNVMGHGGLFKGQDVGQRVMAASLNTPVTVMETAGEGGSWGIALLAGYLLKANGRTLDEYLDQDVFADCATSTIEPDPADAKGYADFMKNYVPGLEVEKAAVAALSLK
ncbi:MAG: ATPase [Ruminococcaceae bacterium]|nr:ATPase [Oscillospiraceae bacterium]